MGFRGVEITGRSPFGLDRAGGYPLFTPDLVAMMYDLIPVERHEQVAVSVIAKAVKPSPTSPPTRV